MLRLTWSKANSYNLLLLVVIGSLLLFSADLFAEQATPDLDFPLDNIYQTIKDAAAKWKDIFLKAASALFWGLATLSLIWTMCTLAMQKADIQAVFVELFKWIMFTGFWYWMLQNAPEHVEVISAELQNLANKAQAAGGGIINHTNSPEGVFVQGFDLVVRLMDAATTIEGKGIWGAINVLPLSIYALIICVFVMMLYVFITFEYFLAQLNMLMLAYMGMFVLGFGGGKWLNDVAMNYYKKVLAQALHLMSLALIIAVATNVVDNLMQKNQFNDMGYMDFILVLAVVILIHFMSKTIPQMVAGLVAESGIQPSKASSAMAAGVAATAVGTATAGAMAVGAAGKFLGSKALDALGLSKGDISPATSEDKKDGDKSSGDAGDDKKDGKKESAFKKFAASAAQTGKKIAGAAGGAYDAAKKIT